MNWTTERINPNDRGAWRVYFDGQRVGTVWNSASTGWTWGRIRFGDLPSVTGPCADRSDGISAIEAQLEKDVQPA